jgi:LPS O-antigen subunit length determinant protein (WzzB/FepE family)
MQNKDNLLSVIETIFRWKRFILITCVVTAVGASIVALLLPVYYKSTTICYPASPDLAVPEAIFGSSKPTNYYGTNNDLDRLMSIANSGELMNFMIDSFNLYEHYDIDPNSRLGPYYVQLNFSKHFHAVKNKFDAMEISVEDRDKDFATRMVNTAREHINYLGQKLVKESQAKILVAYGESIEDMEKRLAVLNDSLRLVREKYGVYNPPAQSEGLSQLINQAEAKLSNAQAKLPILEADKSIRRDTIAFLKASIKGYEKELATLNAKMKTFNDGLAQVDVLRNAQSDTYSRLQNDQQRFKQIKAAYESEFPTVLLVEPGTTPLIKSRPNRTLIVAAAVAAALLFSVLAVLIFDTYKDVNWREVLHF